MDCKIDGSGNKLWDKTIGGSGSDWLFSLEQTLDNGFILGGYSGSSISGDKTENARGGLDYWAVKLDANGNKQWDKTFGGSSTDELRSLHQTSDGGYVLGGISDSPISGDKSQSSKGGYDFWIVRLNANGTKIWDKTFGGAEWDGVHSIIQTADGNYLAGGYSHSGISGDKTELNSGISDSWIIKLDKSGNLLWDKSFGGDNFDPLVSIHNTHDGGYILGILSASGISGDKTEIYKGGSDFWIVKLGPEIVGTSEPAISFNLSISPNPSQGKFKLQLTDLKAAKAEVTVTDLLGRRVLQKELPVTDQQVSEELTLAAAKGIYMLQVKAGEEIISRKMVVE